MSGAYGGRGPVLLGVTWAETALALILFGLRAKTASLCPPEGASFGICGLRWDFVWVMFAYALAFVAQCTMTVSVTYGLGVHQDQLSHQEIVASNYWSWIAQVLAILDLAIARCAVIALLLALQMHTHRKGRWVLLTVGAIQGLINVAEIGVIFHQCDPPQRLWDTNVPGRCDLIETCLYIGYAQGGIGAASDIFLACYPVYIIGRLQQMRLSVKVGLCLLMSGGIIAGIAGINKTVAISTIAETADQTYAIAKLNTWVLTEMWFILIFGSIPVLRPFFVRFSQSIKSVAGYSSSRSRTHDDGDRGGSRPSNETWRDRPDSVLLVDVGGGPGQEMSRFRQRHPDIPGRIILQDLPLTLNRIERIPEGIDPMEHDFFNPQPIKGARAYFFRQVLHNWSDAKSKQILSHIANAMEPEYSTLLIDDYVLPDTGAELRAAEMDILMWLHTAGLERTVSQWRSLFDAVRLELVQIWNTDKGDESVLEVKKRSL